MPDDERPTDGPRGPLDGLIVADLSRVLAGPYVDDARRPRRP
ncbi:MAG: hypothetical protein R2697_13790 [Ilumatobacteraceae bacterium]